MALKQMGRMEEARKEWEANVVSGDVDAVIYARKELEALADQ